MRNIFFPHYLSGEPNPQRTKNVNRNMPVPTTMQTILQPVYAKHAYS